MSFPRPFYSPYAIWLYALLAYILIVGIIQFVYLQRGKRLEHPLLKRSLVSVGAVTLIVGVLGYINNQQVAMDTIAIAGDISPSLVAAGMSHGYPLISIGLVGLGLSFVFKYLNQ